MKAEILHYLIGNTIYLVRGESSAMVLSKALTNVLLSALQVDMACFF